MPSLTCVSLWVKETEPPAWQAHSKLETLIYVIISLCIYCRRDTRYPHLDRPDAKNIHRNIMLHLCRILIQ